MLSGSLDGANLADKVNAFGGYLPDVGGGVCVLHLAQGFDVALVFCPAALWKLKLCNPVQMCPSSQRNQHKVFSLRRCLAQHIQQFPFFACDSHCSVLPS